MSCFLQTIFVLDWPWRDDSVCVFVSNFFWSINEVLKCILILSTHCLLVQSSEWFCQVWTGFLLEHFNQHFHSQSSPSALQCLIKTLCAELVCRMNHYKCLQRVSSRLGTKVTIQSSCSMLKWYPRKTFVFGGILMTFFLFGDLTWDCGITLDLESRGV